MDATALLTAIKVKYYAQWRLNPDHKFVSDSKMSAIENVC